MTRKRTGHYSLEMETINGKSVAKVTANGYVVLVGIRNSREPDRQCILSLTNTEAFALLNALKMEIE